VLQPDGALTDDAFFLFSYSFFQNIAELKFSDIDSRNGSTSEFADTLIMNN
jgi:hypothetical protein